MIYLLRHGRTPWNAAGIVQGRYDVPLSDEGREQARKAGIELSGVPLSHCYCSPLCRAKETAEIALRGRDVPISFDDRLVEMAYGIYENTNWKEGHYQELRRMLAYRYPGGENYLDVAHRAFSFLEEHVQEGEEGNILIVCHGAIGRVIHSYFHDDIDNDAFIDNLAPNGAIRAYNVPKRAKLSPVVPLP